MERAEHRRHWAQRLERVRYETTLARRRYEAVDPQNRLVARTDNAAQQGRAAAGDAVVLGTVCRHLFLVARVGVPVNVGRPAVPAQHGPLLRFANEPPAT